MKFSLRTKIIFVTVAILFCAIGVNVFINSSVFTEEYSSALQSKILIIGQSLKLQLDKLLELEIPVEALMGFEEQCREVVNKYEEISYAMVADNKGKILFHNDPSQHGNVLPESIVLNTVNSGEEAIQMYSIQGEKHYDIAIPVFDAHDAYIATVRIGFPIKLITEKTQTLNAYAAVIAFVSLVLATIFMISTFSVWQHYLRKSMQKIVNGATQLSNASEEFNRISRQMVSVAEQTSRQTHIVSSNSRQISENVDAVAIAAEEMFSNIREISNNTKDVVRVTEDAVDIAMSANTIIANLEAHSGEIGDVINIITAVTQQTNLLALNATIEAARAGEAGKGFSVVASEIRSLSQETANSAKNITQKLEAIQSSSKDAVEAINKASEIIKDIRDLSNSIARGIEQQSLMTQEIADRMNTAARGSQDITRVSADVAATARETSEGAVSVQHAAEDLASLAEQLQQLVVEFKI